MQNEMRDRLAEIIRNAQMNASPLTQVGYAEADALIDHGVTVQEWISVKDRLPEENKYVMIWCGECQVARIEKGISEEQRKAMKRGELDDPCETGWALSSGYFTPIAFDASFSGT